MSYRLLFTNVHGLRQNALEAITSLLTSRQYDIIAIAETWFLNLQLLHDNPFFVTHSLSFRDAVRPGSPPPGGCALFARPELHRSIRATAALDAVCWTFRGRRHAVVYLPPSMPNEDIAPRIATFGSLDVLIGDFNAKIGVDNPRTRVF